MAVPPYQNIFSNPVYSRKVLTVSNVLYEISGSSVDG